MPTKASNQPLVKPVSRPKISARAFSSGWAPAIFGVLMATIVVAIGREFLKITTYTLSGWTALFFLAVFFGLIAANSVSQTRFVSPLQSVSILCGVLSSATTLLLLHWSPAAASTTSLCIATVMFGLTMSMGFRHRPAKPSTFSEKSLEGWAIRLDHLLKYDLDRTIKAHLVTLIEALWDAPKDLQNFIPAQNQSFEESLNALEDSVRCKDTISINKNLDNLARCLTERNQLINTAINVSYRQLISDTAMFPKNRLGSD